MPLGIVQLLYIPCYFFDLKNNTNKPNVLSSRKAPPQKGLAIPKGAMGSKTKKIKRNA